MVVTTVKQMANVLEDTISAINEFCTDRECDTCPLSNGDLGCISPALKGTLCKINSMRYPEHILKILRQQMFDLEADDTSKDFLLQQIRPDEVFESCLTWEGIINYDVKLKSWIKDIYGISLDNK